MAYTVRAKHKKTLARRLKYLEGLGDSANSYDESEISALRHVMDIFEALSRVEESLNIRALVALDLLSDELAQEEEGMEPLGDLVYPSDIRDYLQELAGQDQE